MHQYVLLLVERLCMTVGELVMAYACVERVFVLHPTTMRVNSIRPMLLGACVIASKTSRDGDLGLRQVAPSPAPCVLPLALHLTRPLPPDELSCVPRTHHPLRSATVPFPWQIQENLKDVLDVDVPLLASIEHQMLEVLHWIF